MWYQLYSSQFHYALHLFAALAFFAAGWLYLDAYTKSHQYLKLRIAGFFILAIGSLLSGIQIQFTGSSDANGTTWLTVASVVVPIIGYLGIFLSFPFDPIQRRPQAAAGVIIAQPIQYALASLLPVGSFLVSVMYYFHVAEGLEWHLLLPSISFAIIGLSEIFNVVRVIGASSQSVYMLTLAAPFGLLWWLEHLTLLLGMVFLMRWVFWYLLKSFEMQMVVIAALGVSLLTFCVTAFFVTNLFGSLLAEISREVTQSVKVFSYSIDTKKQEALANAKFIASDTNLIAAVKDGKDNDIKTILRDYVVSRGIRGMMLVNPNGDPVVTNDYENIFSDMKPYALIMTGVKQGIESSMMVSMPGLSGPTIYMIATVPVRSDAKLVGSILLAYSLDSAVTQGIKNNLGLEGALFAGDRLSVASMQNSDSLVGMKETNPQILKQVLVEGKPYEGVVAYNTTEYLGSYMPITNSQDSPIGMMFVGRSMGDVFTIVSQAIASTYIVSTILLMISIIPALYIAKYIIYQVR